jgi:hypothetical protein
VGWTQRTAEDSGRQMLSFDIYLKGNVSRAVSFFESARKQTSDSECSHMWRRSGERTITVKWSTSRCGAPRPNHGRRNRRRGNHARTGRGQEEEAKVSNRAVAFVRAYFAVQRVRVALRRAILLINGIYETRARQHKNRGRHWEHNKHETCCPSKRHETPLNHLRPAGLSTAVR